MHLWAGRIITLVAQHAGAVVCVLTDSVQLVRHEAVMTLRRLDPAALKFHAGAIADAIFDMLDASWVKRFDALCLLGMAMLTSDAFARVFRGHKNAHLRPL